MVNQSPNNKGITADYKVKDELSAIQPTTNNRTSPTSNKPTDTATTHTIHDDALAVMKQQLKEVTGDLQKQNKTVLMLSNRNKELEQEVNELLISLKNKETFKKGQTTRINNLIADLKSSQEEVEELQKKLAKRPSANKEEYEKQIKALETNVTELSVELTQLKSDYSELEQKHDKLIRQSTEAMRAKDEVEGINHSLSESQKEVARLEQVIEQDRSKYENKIAMVQAELDGATKELDSIKSRDEVTEQRVLQAQKQLAEKTLELQQAQESYNVAKQNEEELKTQLELHKDDKGKVEQQLEDANKERQTLTETVEQLNTRIQQLETEHAEVTGHNEQLKADNEQLKADNEQLRVEHEKLKEEQEQTKLNLAQATATKEQLETELQTSATKAESLNSEIETFKAQHTECVSKAEVESLQIKLKELQDNLTNSLTERQQLQNEVQIKADLVKAQQIEIQELQNKLNNTEGDKSMTNQLVEELQSKVNTLESNLASLAELCDTYEKRAEKAEAQAQAFKDLAAMYGAVVAGVAKASPEAEQLFDNELGRHVGSYMHLIDLL